MLKKRLVFTMLAAVLLFAYGCGEPGTMEEDIKPDDPINDREWPAEIEEWIENSRETFGGQTRIYEDKLYILVTYGERPTGGYTVEITDIADEGDKLVVTAHFTEPGEDEMVTQALTYPYDLAQVDETDLTVEFVATGDVIEIPVVE